MAQEKGVAEDTVKQAMVDAAKAQADQAVADGRIAEEQAGELKAHIDEMAANLDLAGRLITGLTSF